MTSTSSWINAAEKILKNPRFCRHINAIAEPLSLHNFLLLAFAVLETEPVIFAAGDQLLSNHKVRK